MTANLILIETVVSLSFQLSFYLFRFHSFFFLFLPIFIIIISLFIFSSFLFSTFHSSVSLSMFSFSYFLKILILCRSFFSVSNATTTATTSSVTTAVPRIGKYQYFQMMSSYKCHLLMFLKKVLQ